MRPILEFEYIFLLVCKPYLKEERKSNSKVLISSSSNLHVCYKYKDRSYGGDCISTRYNT